MSGVRGSGTPGSKALRSRLQVGVPVPDGSISGNSLQFGDTGGGFSGNRGRIHD